MPAGVTQATFDVFGAQGGAGRVGNAAGGHEGKPEPDADGTLQIRLTTTAGVDTEPDWPGSTIAFSTNRHGSGNLESYTMNDNGTAQTRRTTQAGHDVSPTWLPDGTKLALATTRTGNLEIVTMNADGSGPAAVTTHSAADVFPDW